jgi:Asp-tRNA(Asn)/Glu-tRNA(Gln) amidotransferase A subunit family amidase
MQEYERHDALGLAELVRKGAVSPEELLDAALARVSRHNPKLNAIVMASRSARGARSARGFRTAVRGVLPSEGPARAGRGRALTTARACSRSSCPRPTASSPPATAARAGDLRAHGVARARVDRDDRVGAVRRDANPWNLGRSSGGSGRRVRRGAVGILPAAHASDGGGSIRIPAACCGLVGLKPSRARVPMDRTSARAGAA